MTHAPHTDPPARAGWRRLWTPRGIVSYVALLGALTTLLIACGGSSAGKSAASTSTRVVVMATFTPRPADYTPPPNPTTQARNTMIAAARTATAQARANATETSPSSLGSPSASPGQSGDIVFPPPPPNTANLIAPPASVLQAPGGYIGATIGAWNWVETSQQAGGNFTPPWIDLTDESLIVAPGDTATLRFESGSPAPVETKVEIYPYAGNVAIPTTTGGVTAERPAFVRQTDPATSTTIAGADVSFVLNLQPADYIVVATVRWPEVAGFENQGTKMTQYAYKITVR